MECSGLLSVYKVFVHKRVYTLKNQHVVLESSLQLSLMYVRTRDHLCQW